MNSSGNRIIVGSSYGEGKYYTADAKVLEYNEESNECEQVVNDRVTHVKMSADGNTVAAGRYLDVDRYFSGNPCCNIDVVIYNVRQVAGKLYWEKVATITSGPRYYFCCNKRT